MKANPNLPVIFIFDEILLKKIKLSSKRIIFLLDTLRELSAKKELSIFVDDPKIILKNYKYSVTHACVPKYRNITKSNQPEVEFPTSRLAEPIDFYPKSSTSWKKKISLTV